MVDIPLVSTGEQWGGGSSTLQAVDLSSWLEIGKPPTGVPVVVINLTLLWFASLLLFFSVLWVRDGKSKQGWVLSVSEQRSSATVVFGWVPSVSEGIWLATVVFGKVPSISEGRLLATVVFGKVGWVPSKSEGRWLATVVVVSQSDSWDCCWGEGECCWSFMAAVSDSSLFSWSNISFHGAVVILSVLWPALASFSSKVCFAGSRTDVKSSSPCWVLDSTVSISSLSLSWPLLSFLSSPSSSSISSSSSSSISFFGFGTYFVLIFCWELLVWLSSLDLASLWAEATDPALLWIISFPDSFPPPLFEVGASLLRAFGVEWGLGAASVIKCFLSLVDSWDCFSNSPISWLSVMIRDAVMTVGLGW